MTDDALSPAEAVVAAELRRAFGSVADATPSTDRRADLLAVLDRRAADARRAGRGPVVRRLLPVAAALLIVGATVVALAARDDGPEDVGPADPPTDVGPYDDPTLDTGWYLPPFGWKITAVETDYLDVDESGLCPCSLFAAATPAPQVGVLDLSESAIPTERPDEGLVTGPIDIGGRTGVQTVGAPDVRSGMWVDTSGRRISVTARNVGPDVLAALLDGWADALDAGSEVDPAQLPLPDGYLRSSVQRRAGTFEHLLAITAVHLATEEVVEYQLVPTAYQRSSLLIADTVAAGRGGSLAFAGEADGAIAGAIGGPVDITAGPGFFGGDTTLDRDELVTFVDSLREVDVEEWRAALPGGPLADTEVRTAPTLFAPPLTG